MQISTDNPPTTNPTSTATAIEAVEVTTTEEVVVVTNTPQLIRTATPDATPTELQPITPISPCPLAPMPRLIIQERAIVSEVDERPLNVREGPGTIFSTIAQLQPGDIFFVLDGPTCGGEYVWYRIVFGDDEGWIAEGDDAAYYVDPYPAG